MSNCGKTPGPSSPVARSSEIPLKPLFGVSAAETLAETLAETSLKGGFSEGFPRRL